MPLGELPCAAPPSRTGPHSAIFPLAQITNRFDFVEDDQQEQMYTMIPRWQHSALPNY